MKNATPQRIPAGWLALIGACALAASPWAAAQQSKAPPTATPAAPAAPAAAQAQVVGEQLEELDEVVVRGERLYDSIVKAEDKFFELYDELNKDDDFDTHCANVPIDAGSRIESRFCVPSFFADAKAEEIRLSQYCLSMQQKDDDGNVTSRGPCYEPATAEQIFFARRKAYVDNMVDVINSNTTLRKLYNDVEKLHRERAILSHRYDDLKAEKVSTQAERNKGRSTVH